MTKEEIRQAAQKEFAYQFEIGSKAPLEVREGFIKGAEWMQEKMIEKAAEWLYIYYSTLDRSKSFEDAWKHFKRAMEEEND